MKRNSAIVAAVLVAFAAAAMAWMRQTPITAQPAAPPHQNLASKRSLVGAASCSASVCHGGADLGKPGSEAMTWRALDPHARAYDSLLTPRSKTMAKQLWGDKAQAQDAPLCLKCHVHPEYDQARPNFRRADGVGCESCHGAAQDWLSPHYRAAWQQADKNAHGMADARSLLGRANICVRCHVGTPDANVDHDLIAAGHPALKFEFSAYFANLPPHWDVARDRKANKPNDIAGFELQVWLVGQDISRAAAYELRAHRADPKNGRTWPEFAELDCFACHHDLHAKSRRQTTENRRIGKLQMSDWYGVMTFLTNPKVNGVTRMPVENPGADPIRDRIAIMKQAKNHAASAREIVKHRQADASLILRLNAVIELVDKNHPDEFEFGDFSAQLYFAMLTAPSRNDTLLERLRNGIMFPPGYNGPHRLESPQAPKNKVK